MSTNAFNLPAMDKYLNLKPIHDDTRFLSDLEFENQSAGISGLGSELKGAGRIPYTEKHWNEFKQKMAHTLREDALTGDEIFSDTEAKNYIVNYMEKSILTEKSENERLIMNINIRLAHMTIETATGPKVYPIILEYKGHHLMKVSYFYRNKQDSSKIEMGTLEVVPSSIIL